MDDDPLRPRDPHRRHGRLRRRDVGGRHPRGLQGASTVTADAPNKKLTLKIAGYSAGVSPCAANADYYTQSGGECLTLVYAP